MWLRLPHVTLRPSTVTTPPGGSCDARSTAIVLSPAETAEILVALALQAGGRDNVTVVVVDVVTSPAKGRHQARSPRTAARPSSGAEQG